jgi:hypothetical protein
MRTRFVNMGAAKRQAIIHGVRCHTQEYHRPQPTQNAEQRGVYE